MSEDRQSDAELARLPKELVDRLTKPLAQFLRIAARGAGAERLIPRIRGAERPA